VLKRPEILGLIAEHGTSDLERLAQNIVQAALNAGSDDNLTVLLMAIDALPHETLDEVHRKLTQLPIPPVLQVGNKIDGYEVQEIIFSATWKPANNSR
jgi:hypothetical protein